MFKWVEEPVSLVSSEKALLLDAILALAVNDVGRRGRE